MIVCHCHALTDRDIRHAASTCGGCPDALARVCGAGSACGGCRPQVELLTRTAGRGLAPSQPAQHAHAHPAAAG